MNAAPGRYMTTAEVAERTGLSVYQVHTARRAGLLPHHSIGPRLVRFTEDDLAEFERRTQAAQQPAALITTRRKRRRVS